MPWRSEHTLLTGHYRRDYWQILKKCTKTRIDFKYNFYFVNYLQHIFNMLSLANVVTYHNTQHDKSDVMLYTYNMLVHYGFYQNACVSSLSELKFNDYERFKYKWRQDCGQ